MNILLWRHWTPLYDPPATFSTLETRGIGGTESQLLWHAKNLVLLGHRVQVLGVSPTDLKEEGVGFVGARNQAEQERVIEAGRLGALDAIFTEGGFEAVPFLRAHFPTVPIVHVGQNIDRAHQGKDSPLSLAKYIDLFGFVGHGHFAEYCTRYPKLRHKFVMLPNVVPWEWIYKDIPRGPVGNKIVWVGSWSKQGLRQWALTMKTILDEHQDYEWVLCGPSYGLDDRGLPAHVLRNIDLPLKRVSVANLPLRHLAQVISQARAVVVSLGGEAGPGSVLDAHAMARPVISGNDMVYKYASPEGTGVRVYSDRDRYSALSLLIENHSLGDRIGKLGQEFVLANYVEEHQKAALKHIIEFIQLKREARAISETAPVTPLKETFDRNVERLGRRWAIFQRN